MVGTGLLVYLFPKLLVEKLSSKESFSKKIKCDQPKIGVSDDLETFFRIFHTSTNTYFTVARKCHQIIDPKLGVVTIWRHQMVQSANRGPNNEDIKPYLFGAPGKV